MVSNTNLQTSRGPLFSGPMFSTSRGYFQIISKWGCIPKGNPKRTCHLPTIDFPSGRVMLSLVCAIEMSQVATRIRTLNGWKQVIPAWSLGVLFCWGIVHFNVFFTGWTAFFEPKRSGLKVSKSVKVSKSRVWKMWTFVDMETQRDRFCIRNGWVLSWWAHE